MEGRSWDKLESILPALKKKALQHSVRGFTIDLAVDKFGGLLSVEVVTREMVRAAGETVVPDSLASS